MNFKNRGAGWWPEKLPVTWFNQSDPQLRKAMLKLGTLHDIHRKTHHPDYWHKHFRILMPAAAMAFSFMLAFEVDFAFISGSAIALLSWIGLRYYWTRIVYHRYHAHFIRVRQGTFGYAVMFEGDTEWDALDAELSIRKLKLLIVVCDEKVEQIITGYLLDTLEARRALRSVGHRDKTGAKVAIEGAANVAAIEIAALVRNKDLRETD